MNGWIILDKPSGVFSRTAGGRIARAISAKTFGHIGTLDPMASGVLPIAFGNATKMIPFIEEQNGANEKEYDFSIQFGVATDSLDITGNVIARDDFIPDKDDVIKCLNNFIGDISQIPPAYSAVHVNGRRAYEMARSGLAPDIPPRSVHIYSLTFTGIRDNSWHFHLHCSRGTYVRSLGRDIAKSVGAMATVDMIRRVRTGAFDIKNTVQLDFLENLVNNGDAFKKFLNPVDFGLGDIPVLNLDDKSASFYKNGGFIETDACDGLHRVYCNNDFIGIGVVVDSVLHPKRTI